MTTSVKYFFTTLIIIAFLSCNSKQEKSMQNNTASYALRLKPGQDLRASLDSFVKEKNIEAGWLITCAGSLTQYNIRFANQPDGSSGEGHFEIVSLVGTLSTNGSHVHLSISDKTGKTIGGHLLEGCKVYTTAEIVIGTAPDLIFTREKDGTTEWEELQVRERE